MRSGSTFGETTVSRVALTEGDHETVNLVKGWIGEIETVQTMFERGE
ncbi:hypothetical protein [Paenibacillus sp. FSL H7-0331]|nr:hypothetical protein [Paenibacillus sp. FSL H7-0331]